MYQNTTCCNGSKKREQVPRSIQGNLDICLIQGDYTDYQLIFTDENDAPLDLTLYDIVMDIKRTGNGLLPPVFVKSLTNGGLVIDPVETNKLTVVFPNDEMFTKNWGTLFYDMKFELLSSGAVEHWITGFIKVKPSVTR